MRLKKLFNKSTDSKEEKEDDAPRIKRKVSLFRRRKKTEIRPLVRAAKQREYRRILIYFLLFLFVIFGVSTILYLVRFYVVEAYFSKNEEIISPQVGIALNDAQIKKIIEEEEMNISNIQFATESGIVNFTLNNRTQVYILSRRDIQEQLELVEAIDRQTTMSGKQAISIDLRYNKPIVKLQ